MAEFCRQCTKILFDEDTSDFEDISLEEDTKKNLYYVVVCEGCGVIQVDHLGNCISEDCEGEHRRKNSNGATMRKLSLLAEE